MRKLFARILKWFRPGEDGLSERIDDPRDPQRVTRIVYDDDFIQLERPRK